MSNYDQTMVVGLGGAGRNTCNDFQAQGAPYQLISIDQGEGIELALHVSFFRDSRWSEEKKIFSSVDDCAAFLKERTSKFAKLIFVAGLGGRTGSKLFLYFARSSDFKEATFVCFLPFKFEGEVRKKMAEEVIAQINNDIVDLKVYSNQDLFESAHPKETFTEAFKRLAIDVYHEVLFGKKEQLTNTTKKKAYPRTLEGPTRSSNAKRILQPIGQSIFAHPRHNYKSTKNKASKTKQIIALTFSIIVAALIFYEKISLDKAINSDARGFFEETIAAFYSVIDSSQNSVSDHRLNGTSVGTSVPSFVSQDQWMEEVKRNFFQLSASDRARIQKWLADNYEYNGALDGLWGPRTEAGFLRASSTHRDIDRLFLTAFRETPAIRQASRQPTQNGSPANARQDLQNQIIQLRAACSVSPRGSLGERLADQQLYLLTGERCARPPPAFQPLAPIQPIQPNAPTRCTQRLPPGNFRIPGMTYPLEFECQ